MTRMVRCGRRGGLVLAGVGSVFSGVAMINALIRPGVIESVGTPTLGVILALLLLPGLAFVALRVERETPARAPASSEGDGREHDGASRRSPAHRRRSDRTSERLAARRA